MEQKNKMQMMLILASAGILFLLIVVVAAVSMIGKNQSGNANSQPDNSLETTITPVQPRSPETVTAEKTVGAMPFRLSPDVPQELFLSIQDNSQNGAVTSEITYEGDNFKVVLTPLTHPGVTEVGVAEGIRPYPPVYSYNPEDFERLTVIDGKELFISKTGATGFDIASDSAVLSGRPRMSANTPENFGETTEYYVYQKYGDYGISEYLSIFTDNPGEMPSYNQNLIIRYSITEPAAYENWDTHKKWLKQVIDSLKERQ